MPKPNEKIKVYKNPARNKPDVHKPYVPQYQVMGVEPEEYKSPLSPGYRVEVAQPSQDNPRTTRAVVRQPYAEVVHSPIGRGRGLLPNVGNNLEQTWSSVDGEIVDDISGSPLQHTIIDNNELVSEAALGLPDQEEMVVEEQPFPSEVSQVGDADEMGGAIFQSLVQMEGGDYLLLINGEVICSGPLDLIQNITRELVFGEHEICKGNPIPVDDILVIKKAKIEVGVFLE